MERRYAGVDRFRLAAALLVVAIHTSPLTSYSGTGDFILTRIAARTAVPFFLMASGFFLFSDGKSVVAPEGKRLLAFLRKTGLLYAAAALLYLPLNFYTGVWRSWSNPLSLVRDIVLDGTFYHLWYLPAAILGAGLVWLLLKYLRPEQALCAAALLYAVGLFGDSYYGLAERLPLLRSFYGALFSVSDYTRNGLFLAPLFLLLGGCSAKWSRRLKPRARFAGLAAFSALLLGEGLLLHGLGVQRHDSMYLFLPLCVFFLFQALLLRRGAGSRALRDAALLVYLIHPMMIVLVRGFAKAAGLQPLLIENSLGHFLAVAAASLLFSAALVLLPRSLGSRAAPRSRRDRAWAEIDLDNLDHNVRVLRSVLPTDCALMAVVKADAYGHGAVPVARRLNRMGLDSFAVATLEEGIALRRNGIRGEILILGYTDPAEAPALAKYRLSQTVADAEHGRRLNAFGKPLPVHVKVDTGMRRLGIDSGHTEEIAGLFGLPNLKIQGLFTHLCVSDSLAPEDREFTGEQIRRFYAVTEELQRRNIRIPRVHMQSSYGVLNYPELRCGCARVGIALYGTLSSPGGQTVLQPELRPLLSLKTRVALVRTVPAGETLGYGRQFTAREDTVAAVLSIGYADGLPRSLSCGRGAVLLHGCRAPILGRVCMDQLAVDVTGIPGVARGDTATVIGRDGGLEITAPELAEAAGTIANELLSRLGARLERVYLSSGPGGLKVSSRARPGREAAPSPSFSSFSL